MMQELANSAIETAKRRGASYADVRVMDIRHRDISTKNGEVGNLAESESLGIGIRVIAGGAWGFSSTDRLTSEGVQACAAEAVAIAKASALAKRENISLAPEHSHVDTWQNPFLKDPFRIPVEQQIDLLLAADKEMRRVKGVTVAEGSMSFRRIEQLFASSTGSAIHQIKMQSGAGIVATSFAGTEIQKRSYPNSFGGQHMLQGYELVESLDLAGNAGRIAEECVALHSAAQCPEGQQTIILGSSQLGGSEDIHCGDPIPKLARGWIGNAGGAGEVTGLRNVGGMQAREMDRRCGGLDRYIQADHQIAERGNVEIERVAKHFCARWNDGGRSSAEGKRVVRAGDDG